MKRKQLTKKARFEIFKRDKFTCQYCGSNPPSVVLEVDHIKPVSKGGGNDEENLITSCFDCNRGKGARDLSSSIPSLEEKIAREKELEDQLKEWTKLKKRQQKRIDKSVEAVEEVYSTFFRGWGFSDKFRISVKRFIKQLGEDEVVESMERACLRVGHRDNSLKYFCGICWRKIKGE